MATAKRNFDNFFVKKSDPVPFGQASPTAPGEATSGASPSRPAPEDKPEPVIMVHMVSPAGRHGDIPLERVPEARKAGFKHLSES